MNAANEAVIEKLKKILILANDKGATEGEIAAAMAKAKDIAMRHQIDIAGIDLNSTGNGKTSLNIERGDIKFRANREQKYHRWIYAVLGDVFGVQMVRLHSSVVFIGETTDVMICKTLFPWLEDVFYKTYNRYCNEGAPRCAATKNGVYRGLWMGIKEANKREVEKLSTEDKSKWGLIVRDKNALIEQKMNEQFPELKAARNTQLSYSPSALNHGYREGKKINLRQTGPSSTKGQLR